MKLSFEQKTSLKKVRAMLSNLIQGNILEEDLLTAKAKTIDLVLVEAINRLEDIVEQRTHKKEDWSPLENILSDSLNKLDKKSRML